MRIDQSEAETKCDPYLNGASGQVASNAPGLWRKGEARRAALAVVLESTRFNGTSTDDIRAACDAIDAFTEGN
jgi:hypothetical protein